MEGQKLPYLAQFDQTPPKSNVSYVVGLYRIRLKCVKHSLIWIT